MLGPSLWVILLEDRAWLHDDIGLLDSDLKDQPCGSVLHALRTKVPSAKPSGLPPSQVVVAAFCRDDTHEHIKKVEMQKLSCPSGPFGVSSISLLCISPYQGPTDLKGPLLPGHEGHLSQRAGTTAKADEGAECMTKKSPNTWHWV